MRITAFAREELKDTPKKHDRSNHGVAEESLY